MTTTGERVWCIGNTTVREALRLPAALRVLVSSPLYGRLDGVENEDAFARLLDEHEVVYATRLHLNPPKSADDLGRKWRSALTKLGFLTPGKRQNAGLDVAPYTLSPNGRRLVDATNQFYGT